VEAWATVEATLARFAAERASVEDLARIGAEKGAFLPPDDLLKSKEWSSRVPTRNDLQWTGSQYGIGPRYRTNGEDG
jgi:hypothetical protein